ncbi:MULTISPECIES: hypothetical protein [Nocardiaceae]|uniref:Uncharacterized protein n=1 Tax=Rhodococcoides kroppenstedtii TaxID=293050 RepID=A0ABS7NNL8_9NOCA|nr:MULTISPECIES: hypothetical protein [Rhodococcus]AMY19581.1 hypothetical protein A3Q40_02207 [Rhodococcus sp. PBTS 1]MBY6312302.1 hypothetical protein [Rhodococcus kroppenstedtii]MBY6319614.1 hypothetical protein [Rhodococcus kroppenstedtii]MBY6398297.1 hypothetical protein [Rhodococcus kroppenstedtii]MBY6436120.1 hypothetical protein [Rhodococcus kroppenstedtii]
MQTKHTEPGRCDTAAVAAATAALLSVPWGDHLAPADVQTVAFALRLVHRTVDADPELAGALETARGHVCRAAESWYAAVGRDAGTAAWEARAAFDDLCDVLQLADCTCEDPAAGYRVLAAAVADTVESVVRYLRSRSGPPVPWEAGPDQTTVLHLRRAAAEMTTVTGALSAR